MNDSANSTISNLNDCMATSEKEGYLKCEVCSRHVYRTSISFHIWHHIKIKPIVCPVCDKDFYYSQAYDCKVHMRKAHPNSELAMIDNREKYAEKIGQLKKKCFPLSKRTQWRILCQVCNKRVSFGSVSQHIWSHLNIKPISCPICHRKFEYTRAYKCKQHIITSHPGSNAQIVDGRDQYRKDKEDTCMRKRCFPSFGPQKSTGQKTAQNMRTSKSNTKEASKRVIKRPAVVQPQSIAKTPKLTTELHKKQVPKLSRSGFSIGVEQALLISVEPESQNVEEPPTIEPQVEPSVKQQKMVYSSQPTFGLTTMNTGNAQILSTRGQPNVENPSPDIADEVESYPCQYCPERVYLTSFDLERHTKLCHKEHIQQVMNEINQIQEKWKQKESERKKQRERMTLAKIRQEALAIAAAREVIQESDTRSEGEVLNSSLPPISHIESNTVSDIPEPISSSKTEYNCVHCKKMLEKGCDPKILPCFHLICSGCFIVKNDYFSQIPCGKCDEKFKSDDVLEFNLIQGPQLPLCTACCELCKQNGDSSLIVDQATHYCMNCEENLCLSCVQAHKITKLVKNHPLKALSSTESTNKCSVHPSNCLDYFCTTCSMVVCPECFLAEHNLHVIEKMQDRICGLQLQYGNVATQLTYQMNVAKQPSKESFEMVEKSKEKAKNELEICYNNLQKLLEKRKEQTLSQIEGEFLKRKERFSKENNIASSVKEKISQCQTLAESLSKYNGGILESKESIFNSLSSHLMDLQNRKEQLKVTSQMNKNEENDQKQFQLNLFEEARVEHFFSQVIQCRMVEIQSVNQDGIEAPPTLPVIQMQELPLDLSVVAKPMNYD